MFLLPSGARAELYRQMNEANQDLPIPITEGDLYFGKVGTAKDSQGRITLPTVAMYDAEYDGYVKFQYQRLDFTKAFGTVRPTIKAVGSSTLHAMLPIISQALGITITPEDVIDVNVNWLGGTEAVNIELIAKPTSPGFEGKFIITYQRVRPLLSNMVKLRDLDCLKHPQVDLAKRSTNILTWGIDYTDHLDVIVQYGSWWLHGAKVQTLMASKGFPDWPAGWATDLIATYLTKNVPEANQAFTHVIIQKGVVRPDYAGIGYFHFNR